MKHILFGSDTKDIKVAILIKEGMALNKTAIERHYLRPQPNLKPAEFIAYSLKYDTPKKCKAATAREHLVELMHEINQMNITTIMVCDAVYFKILTKNKKVEPHYGYVCPCTIKGYEHINVIVCPNHTVIMYNPLITEKINRAIKCLDEHIQGTYQEPGKDIIHSAYYPSSVIDIKRTLEALHKFPELTVDIEAKSLEFWNAGISTISFAWDEHNGVAFAVERDMDVIHEDGSWEAGWKEGHIIGEIKSLLYTFFTTYTGKLTYHNIGYDGKVLVYELWMDGLADYPGMIKGIKEICKNFDDTKLIAYFATNNAVQNTLGLKDLAAPFTGDYAENTTDTTIVPIQDLLEYNLKDCLATWYVKKKYEPIMIADQQQDIYENEFKEYVLTLMNTEMNGMPINPVKVQEAKAVLSGLHKECCDYFANSTLVQDFHKKVLTRKAAEATAKAKKKVYTVDDPTIARQVFNPNSSTQMREFLYEYLDYPILDLTDTKLASCAGKTIKKLIHIAKTEEHKDLLNMLVQLADVNVILNNFIPAFENAQQLPDGSWRLYGNYNLGGTQSLRLSSSNPNLQNIPMGSKYAKLIKECFMAIFGWLFVGSDMDAIEDKTGALLTRDPQRLKIYTDGFCGHCLRTQYYWPDKMPEIDPNSVESVNSIADLYEKERQDSKAPSFALQYGGSYYTLMNNCGFSKEEAKTIEANYHKLYVVSDQWVDDLIEKAKEVGYIPMALGGRIRTPLLAKTVGKSKMPYAAIKEGRSAGNAATQSYCALTLRAMNEYRKRLWASPYVYEIFLSATVHDSIYSLTKDNADKVKWINDNLIECMAWNELPELQHPTIKISSSLEIYWPSWANKIKIPNNATKDEIKTICKKAQEK